MSKQQNRVRPQVESLEPREVPAYINLVGNVVQAVGDDGWHDNVTVDPSGSQVVVRMFSVWSGGLLLPPLVTTQTFSRSAVGQVRFWGFGGNDSFINNVGVSSTAFGGDGNDYLEGANLPDFFYGGAGSDTLVGYGGDDWLYGENGSDLLNGMSGTDQLIGGAGYDAYRDDYQLVINGTSASDVQQGESGVCTILAGVAETMLNPLAGRGNWTSRVRSVGGGSYDVWLYQSASPYGGVGRWYRTTFDGTWYDDDAQPSLNPGGAREMWPVIVQRAVLDSYGVPWRTQFDPNWGDWWRTSRVALERLTGYTASYQPTTISVFGIRVPVARPESLANLLSNYFVAAETRGDTGTGDVVTTHAYAVRGVSSYEGVWYVDLYNPWGRDTQGPNGTRAVTGADDGYLTITWDTFLRAFEGYWYA